MKKIYLLVALFLSIFSYSQNFDSFASGVKINSTVYNVTSSAPIQQINPAPDAQNFDGSNLGTFGQNSSCAKITGGEIKTWKTASGNVCGTTLNWRVYPASASPSGSFNSVPLTTISECDLSTNAFYDGFGPCSNNDQKWKDYSINIDFVNSLTTGNYILEIYYTLTGSDVNASTCETIKYINNSGLNYKASFTVSNPITDPTASSTSVCEGESLTLIANPSGGVSPYTFSWTGPNGFTSTDENPIINNISLSNAGAYSLIVTDACGSFSNSKSTAAVVVNAKIDPEFDATLPAICKNGIAPLLSTTSTNGITGSWNPPIVSNTATATYVFTPDPGQCANSLSFTVFVVNNVSPAFTLPTSICFGATPPVLNNISNNGIVGTWSPATVSNTSSGTYTFTPSSLQCALPVTVQINVNPLFAVFTPAIPPICSGEVLNDLPTTSTNGVTGTWSPAINNTATTTYTFTPTAGQCTVTPVTMTIVVNPIAATFTPIAPICSGDALAPLPTTSDNGVTGTWSPATNNTATTTYTFT
ncbi:immunoglobulin domain-containing protein, partial [Flavobacterium sp.]|uniref:immunoglobulin domain-containing protein n=1 Tax=Flavobacterium sp. TaxID=239 RepID=UPI0025C5E7F2